jgi:hypothetical protein
MTDNCTHGIPLIDHECEQCDRVWEDQVTLPQVRALIHRLMRFYNVETLRELVFAQDHHIEKLQAKLPMNEWKPERKVRA